MASKARMPSEAPGRDAPDCFYNGPRGMGTHVDSGFRTEPTWSMSSKARTPVEAGGDAPGAIYKLPGALERQPARMGSSQNRSAPRPSFSRNSRWAHYESEQKRNTVPGPGRYG